MKAKGLLYHSPAGQHEIYLTLAWIIHASFAFAFFDGLAKFAFDDSNLSPGASCIRYTDKTKGSAYTSLQAIRKIV